MTQPRNFLFSDREHRTRSMEQNHINHKKSEYDKKEKERYAKTVDKIKQLTSIFEKIVVIQCSQVGSFQLQKIRKKIRGEAEIVRGKVVSQ